MRRLKLVRKTNMPFLCHVVTHSVMPRPRHRDPLASARMMMMMKANGWLPCYKSVPVTVYKMQKVPVCCPGTIPTPIGACMVRTPVPTPQLANRKRLSPGQLLLSKTKAFRPQPRQPTKGRTGTPSRKLPLPARRPVFWKTPRPSRGMMSPKKPVGLRIPPPALLRMLSSRTGAPSSRATSNRNQKASPVKVKSRPTFPVPKPLPPSSFMLPLLTSLMLKSQSTEPSFKRQPPKPQTRPSPPVFHKRLNPTVPSVKSLPAKPLMKPIPAKLVSKSPPMGPLFGPGPAGPLFQIVMSMLNRVRHLPTKPVPTGSNPTPGPIQSPPAPHSIGPFPRALVDDFLFSPEPLSTGSTVKPLLKDFLDDLLFSSVFRPNFPGPLPKFGAGDRFSNVPFPFMHANPLSNIPPPLLNMRSWSDSHFPMMNAGPLSMFRPPFIPAALLSSLLAPEVVPKPYAYPRPPTIPNLNARSPVMPPSFLSDLRPQMMAKSSPANIQHPQRPDLLSKVRPPMMPLGLLPNSRSPMVVNGPLTNLPPPAFSAGSLTKARPPVRPADSQSGQEPQVKAPQSQQAAPEKTKSSELSEWQKEVARYLATMMYHKLQVEQQHKKLLTEVSRQNSLRRQMELLLTQQIIQTYQREQQRKQKEEEQQQQQQQQQQKQLQQQQIIQQQQQLLLQQQQQQQIQQQQVQQQQEQQQRQQQQEEDAGSQQEDVSFQLSPSLPPQTVTVPPLSFQEESTTPVMHQPGLSEVVQEDPYAEPVGDKLLPLVRGILDEIPQPRPPLFAAASLPPGLEEMQTEMAEVKQKVRNLVNDCLARSNLSVTMEQVLQSGEPGNLRPICRKSNTVGPCVLAQTQDVMGQDHMGMTGRQLVQSVLMALGQACAKLEEGEHLMDSTDSDVTSTAVFPNPPPEMIQEVATEVPMAEPEGDSPMLAQTTSDVAVAPPEEPSVTVEKATPLPPKIPEVGQGAHVDKEPEVTSETEITLPLWMILVIVSTCAGILLFTGVCVCLVWRHRRKGTADVIDREPEKLPVPATVNMALPPPAYPQAGEGLGEDVNFKIPEDTENRQRIG